MKLAFVTLLSDDYCLGGALSIYTLLKSTPNFTYPIIILEWGQLSSNSKKKLKTLYSNITFKRIITRDYPKQDFDKTHRRWGYNCGYRFDIFTLTQFDKILFFDSDIIFQQDMNNIINTEINFGVIERPIERAIQFNGKRYFNGGLLLIGKKYLNKKVKEDLLLLLQQAAPTDSRDILITSNKWVGNEPILNTYFEPYATFIEKKYNFCIDECKTDTLKHQYNLHFIGENKPWNASKFDAHITNTLVEQNTQVCAIQIQQQLIKFVHTNLNSLYRNFPIFLTRQTLHTTAKLNLFLKGLDIKP